MKYRHACVAMMLLLGACAGSSSVPSDRRATIESQTSATPSSVRIRNSKTFTSDHVRLTTSLPDGPLRDRLKIVLEESVRSFGQHVIGGDAITIEVYALRSESDWQRAVQDYARQRTGQRVPLGSGLSRAAVTIDGVSFIYDIGGPDALRLAAHEAWHAFSHQALQSRLPVWLEEALACQAEGLYWDERTNRPLFRATANPSRRGLLRQILEDNRLGSLESHLRQDPTELTNNGRAIDDYYARAWVLGVLLDDPPHTQALTDALARAARGMLPATPRSSVPGILGISVEELDRQWRMMARQLARH